MQRVHIIFTGGTIAMRTNAEGLLVPASLGDELLQAIPQLEKIADISTEQLCNVASAHLTSEIWLQTRRAIMAACADEGVAGVVLVQGTDTLEETAFFLDASLSQKNTHGKPIVLTGAMRNADEANADGPHNLRNAISIAVSAHSREKPIMACMFGKIYAARAVQKQHSTRTDAFVSTHHAPIGQVSDLGEVLFFEMQMTSVQTPTVQIDSDLSKLPKVDIIPIYVGADADAINHGIAAGAQAIVVQALGAGNLNPAVFAAIERALQKDIPIVIATRCWEGNAEPHYGYIGGGQTLAKIGACFAHDLPAHKARIYAQLLLAQLDKHSKKTPHIRQGFAQLVAHPFNQSN